MYPHQRPLTERQEDLMKTLYYNKNLMFGIQKLFKYLQENHANYNIYRAQVAKWLKSQEIYQLYQKKPVKRKSTRTIFSNKAKAILQLDLIDFSKRPFNNYNYILTAVDIYSRKLWAYPLQAKTVEEVERTITPLIEELKPQVIQTDSGNEFRFNPDDVKMLKSPSYTPQTQGIVERINGIIKNVIYKYLYNSKTNNWVDILPVAVEAYNDTYHTSLKNTPNKVFAGTVQVDNRKKVDKDKDKIINEGTYVRLKVPSSAYKTKGAPIYSKNIFKIIAITKGKDFSRNRYKLQDIGTGRVAPNTYNNTQFIIIPDERPIKFERMNTRQRKREIQEEIDRPKTDEIKKLKIDGKIPEIIEGKRNRK